MKKALIIGASSGIGKALALRWAAQGITVYITGRRENLLQEIQQQYPQQIKIAVFDVNTLQNNFHLEKIASEAGQLEAIVYSSGVGEFNKQLDFTIEKSMVDTNAVAFTQIADWCWHYFKQKEKGVFARITSIAGMMSSRHAPAYNASKAYQINYLKSLRLKAAYEKLKLIQFTDLRTGFVDTPMAKAKAKFWVADVNKAAAQMDSAIKNKKKVAYITKRWRLVGWLSRHFS
jgi:short-subunit dehydrogenase